MLSPIFTIEAITTARRTRYFWFRCVYALFLLFMLVMTYLSQQQMRLFAGQGVANLARDFFFQFTWIQLTAILLLTPAMTAGTIAGELERKTLDYLLVCPLSSASILWGKLGARLLLSGLLIAGGAPVLAAAMLLGGIPPLNLLTTAIVSLSTLLTVGALSVGVSVWAVRTRDAILSAYILLLSLLVLPLLGMTARQWSTTGWWAAITDVIATGSEAMFAINPYLVAYTNDFRHFSIAIGIQLLFAAAIVTYAGWRLRGLAAKRTGAEARRWKLPTLRWRPQLGHNAMLWKEMFIEKTALRWGWLVRLALVGLLAAVMIPTVMMFVELLDHPNRDPEGMYFMYGLIGSLTLVVATARAATLVTNERERDTWLTLISSPLTARQIVSAKILGNLYAMRWPVALMTVIMTMMILVKPKQIIYVPLVMLDLAVLLAFCSAWGVQCSLMFQNSTSAMWSAVGTVVLLGGGYLICCGPGIMFLGVSGRHQEVEVLMSLSLAPTMPFLLVFPGVAFEHTGNIDGGKIALFVAWLLGTIGYAVATNLMYLGTVHDFNLRAGRTLNSPDSQPTATNPLPPQ
jgi:ABC-type transport system involved in multi-copper enzyme maturation permease subunit